MFVRSKLHILGIVIDTPKLISPAPTSKTLTVVMLLVTRYVTIKKTEWKAVFHILGVYFAFLSACINIPNAYMGYPRLVENCTQTLEYIGTNELQGDPSTNILIRNKTFNSSSSSCIPLEHKITLATIPATVYTIHFFKGLHAPIRLGVARINHLRITS